MSVQVYVTTYCPYCYRAKNILSRNNVPFETIDVTRDHEKRAWLVQATGQKTVPQIFINGVSIGGSDELAALEKSGELLRRTAIAAAT